jgi:hypothetical protein
VVDVRNDAEIADVLGIHGLFSGGAAPPAAMPPRLVRANHAFQTSEFAIHRQKIEICPSAEQSYFHAKLRGGIPTHNKRTINLD